MGELFILLILIAVVFIAIVLPIVLLVIFLISRSRLSRLEARLDRIEAMLAGRSEFPSVAEATPEAPPPVTTPPVSVLWAAYAAGLAALGFVRRLAAVRWAALALFALTIIKAMLVDIAQLQQLYRIIVFFVLGVLLLLVAWRYHKAFHASQPDSSV